MSHIRIGQNKERYENVFITISIWEATKLGDAEINGWTHEDASKLVSYIYHTCQSGRTFLRKSGILENEIDVGNNFEKLVEIYDNPNDSALKDKIIPFLAQVLK